MMIILPNNYCLIYIGYIINAIKIFTYILQQANRILFLISIFKELFRIISMYKLNNINVIRIKVLSLLSSTHLIIIIGTGIQY